jgi:hypothetical protein
MAIHPRSALLVVVLTVCGALAAHSSNQIVPFQNCGDGVFKPTRLDVSPSWPPVRGTDVTVTVIGDLSKEVTDATYELQVDLYTVRCVEHKGNLSDVVALKYPIEPTSQLTVTKSFNLPHYTVPGHYTVRMDTSLFCFQVAFIMN